MDLVKYRNWIGSREELVITLSELEERYPKKFALFSKTTGKLLPLKKTRIQRLIELNVISGPDYFKTDSTKAARYGQKHILQYLAAIVAKKSGFTFEQIAAMMQNYKEDDFIQVIEKETLTGSANNLLDSPSSLSSAREKTKILKSLDRKEGRALISEQILIAITPWLHINISKKNLKRLGPNEIEIVCQTTKDALTELTKAEHDK